MQGYDVQQSTTAYPLVFLLISSTDHLTGLTGAAVTATLSKSGAAFGSPAGAVAEIGSGWYKVAGNATDTATLGPLALHATATGADPTDALYPVVSYNPQSATAFMTSVASVVGAVGSVTGNVSGSVASVTGNVGGNVVGSVGSVTGNVGGSVASVAGNVVGTVASVVGNVGGNVTGSVGSILGVTFPTNFAVTSIDTNGNVKIQGSIKKNTALAGFPFYMALSSDHVSPGTGKTIASTVSLNGGAFSSSANVATEIGNGWYEIDLGATDLNGATVALSFAATSCDTTILTIATQP